MNDEPKQVEQYKDAVQEAEQLLEPAPQDNRQLSMMEALFGQ